MKPNPEDVAVGWVSMAIVMFIDGLICGDNIHYIIDFVVALGVSVLLDRFVVSNMKRRPAWRSK